MDTRLATAQSENQAQDQAEVLASLRAAIRVCVPHGAELALGSDSPPPGFALHTSEAVAVSRARSKRRQQFSAGRALARQALEQLGHQLSAIPAGESGAPVWPEAITGSISHCDDIAVALVGWQRQYRSLGIDVEHIQTLSPNVRALVLTDAERAAVRDDRAATLHFCAKEALYKCLAPLGGDWLDFADVSLRQHNGQWIAAGTNPPAHQLLAATQPSVALTHSGQLAAAVAWCRA